jgi:hypothetical protein
MYTPHKSAAEVTAVKKSNWTKTESGEKKDLTYLPMSNP